MPIIMGAALHMPTAPRWHLVSEHVPVRMATRVTGSCVRVSLGPHIRLGAQGGMAIGGQRHLSTQLDRDGGFPELPLSVGLFLRS